MTSRRVDPFAPWHEGPSDLWARHVGQAELVAVMRDVLSAWAVGRAPAPLPLYLFGPRGSGKSHLLALARDEARRTLPPGVRVRLVPEDAPQATTARELLDRIRTSVGWSSGPPMPTPPGVVDLSGTVVFIESLDLHLESMGEQERRELRRVWQSTPFLLLGTGRALGEAFTSHDTAFFGAFQAWPVGALGDVDAAELLDRTAGSKASASVDWPVTRRLLVLLAGGSPRVLVALGQSCAARPDAGAADHLVVVLRELTADYQLRFRNLSPQQQQILERMAFATGQLTPSALAAALGGTTTGISIQCRRMADAGVLAFDAVGRHTWYRVRDPLFRYWIELRSGPWAQSRIAAAVRGLEATLRDDTSGAVGDAPLLVADGGAAGAWGASVPGEPAERRHAELRSVGGD